MRFSNCFLPFSFLGGEFVVPTIFLTNGGNTLRANKAKSLSELLDVEIQEDQVLNIELIREIGVSYSSSLFPAI